jgi:hypothetical protein
LSEEVLVVGFAEAGSKDVAWLEDGEALRLLAEARPDANLPNAEKKELVERSLGQLGEWRAASGEWGKDHPLQNALRTRIQERAKELEESHKRIRQAMLQRVRGLDVKPQFPPDLLGLLILQPEVRR